MWKFAVKHGNYVKLKNYFKTKIFNEKKKRIRFM